MKLSFLTAIIIIQSIICLSSQDNLRFEVFNTRLGLCHNRITSLYQDSIGFLWIGTENGLSRFDGTHFRNYFPNAKDSSSISSEIIYNILPDFKGNFWIETTNGITYRNPSLGFRRFQMYPTDLKTRLEARFFGSAICGGKFCIESSGEQLMFFDINSQKFRSFKEANLCPFQGKIHRLYSPRFPGETQNDSVVFVFTTEGIYQYQPYHNKKYFFYFPMIYGSAFPLYLFNDHLYFSIWEKGLYSLNLQKGTFENIHMVKNQKLPNIIHAFLPCSDDECWLGTEGGLYSLNWKTRTASRIPLPNESETPVAVKSLITARDGIIWIGTENGLLKMSPKVQGFFYQKILDSPEFVYENQIYDVLDEPELQRTLVVSRSGLFSVLSGDKIIKSKLLKDGNGHPLELTRILKDSRNNYWLASRWEVFLLDPLTFRIKPIKMPKRRQDRAGLVWVLKEDPLGRIWCGLSRDGIVLYDPRDQSTKYLDSLSNNFFPLNIWDIQIDNANGRVWVGTDNEGLWEADIHQLKFKQWNQMNTSDLPSDQIAHLEQDFSQNLWMSTPSGLCCVDIFQSKQLKILNCLTTDNGLPTNFIEGIQLDKEGNVWGGTTGMLVKLNPYTLELETFDYRYGVDFTPFPISHLNLSSNGEMFAGGKWGFLRWMPSFQVKDTMSPRLVLTGVSLGGRPYRTEVATEVLKEIVLNPGQSNFSLELTSVDFSLPEKNQILWKLEAYDKDWTAGVGHQRITYNNMPPGSFLFLARNADPRYQSSGDLKLMVRIVPFFWQTGWFKSLVLILVISGLIVLYNWRLHQISATVAMKQEMQKRISEIEMAALRAQMNPHFVFNSLNSINRFIQLSDPDTASDYLTKFARLIRLVLDNSKEEKVSLEQEIQAIRLYVELEVLRFSGKFKYKLKIDENLDLHGTQLPPMLIQPFVENAIWHGLMHKDDDEGMLYLSISRKGKFLEIVVQDNGIGRKAAQAIKDESKSMHKSHSTDIGKERLTFFQKIYSKEVSLDIQDIYNKQGHPEGTRVVLCIGLFDLTSQV